MSCIQNCKVEEIVVTMSVGAGVFVLTAFANQGAVIDFDEDETEVSREIDSNGDFYMAGQSWVNRPFTVTTNCTPEALIIDAAWLLFGPVDFCGSGVVITNCCSGGYVYRSLRLENMKAPSIGNDVGTYTFNFEGIASAS